MDLIEYGTKERMSREQAAARLRELADQLARHNNVQFVREGVKYTLDVPDEVEVKVEIEVEDDESEIEVKLKW